MKRVFLSVLFLLSFCLCFAKTENGYECYKKYVAHDDSYYSIGVIEVPEGAVKDNGYEWSIMIEGFDSDNSQSLLTAIYYKEKSSALKEYTRSLKSQKNKIKTFTELLEYYENPENNFVEHLDISTNYNIPLFIFFAYGE